ESHARQDEFSRPAVPAVLAPGEFYPRIWRGHEHPPSGEVGLLDAETSTRRVAYSLSDQLDRIFWYVEPTQNNRTSYGHRLRELLIVACTEVESSWKSILKAHQYTLTGRWNTKDYVRLCSPLHLSDWSLSLANHSEWG